MKLTLTLGAIEAFEDTAGLGIFELVNAAPDGWTVKRVRALYRAGCPDASDADIEAHLSRDYTGAFIAAQNAVSAALSPPPEADDVLAKGRSEAQEGGESGGNSGSGAG